MAIPELEGGPGQKQVTSTSSQQGKLRHQKGLLVGFFFLVFPGLSQQNNCSDLITYSYVPRQVVTLSYRDVTDVTDQLCPGREASKLMYTVIKL